MKRGEQDRDAIKIRCLLFPFSTFVCICLLLLLFIFVSNVFGVTNKLNNVVRLTNLSPLKNYSRLSVRFPRDEQVIFLHLNLANLNLNVHSTGIVEGLVDDVVVADDAVDAAVAGGDDWPERLPVEAEADAGSPPTVDPRAGSEPAAESPTCWRDARTDLANQRRPQTLNWPDWLAAPAPTSELNCADAAAGAQQQPSWPSDGS